MQGTIIVSKINARLLPTVSSMDVGDLYLNDRVYGDVNDGWISFDRVYKANGVIDDGTRGFAAVTNPLNRAEVFIKLEDKPEPVPAPTPEPEPPAVKPLTVTITGEDYESVTVELKPK
jgi:hypothetical protein